MNDDRSYDDMPDINWPSWAQIVGIFIDLVISKFKSMGIYVRDVILDRECWVVDYPEGTTSTKMRYSEALNYARIFDGKVRYEPRTE